MHGMMFLWPDILLMLLAVPALVGLYVITEDRQRNAALKYGGLRTGGLRSRIGRHVTPLMFLLGLVGLIMGAARPVSLISLPSQQKTVILAMDVSGSMDATDISPTRLAASQQAAREFIDAQPPGVRIGIVSFAGTASLVQSVTANRAEALSAIDRFYLQPATAIGSGILVSLQAIFPGVRFDLDSSDPRPGTSGTDAEQGARKHTATAGTSGSGASAAIILLTDGQTNSGPDPVRSARMAAERGVRIFTVGVGTEAGEIVGGEGWYAHVRLDEKALRSIAETTGGEYFQAESANELKKVYRALNERLVMEKERIEIAALFLGVASIVLVVSALLALTRFGRVL